MLPAITEARLGLIPYFPLGGGALTGKYRKGQPLPEDARTAAARTLPRAQLGPHREAPRLCRSHGHTILELAMSWLAARPAVASIIAGATKVHQLEANAKSADWKLTPAELAEVDKLTAG